MAINDILTQDEIDALLHGVNSGDVETQTDAPVEDGVAKSYDFATQDRIVRGRMPTLEMINERFARHFRINLFNMLRRRGLSAAQSWFGPRLRIPGLPLLWTSRALRPVSFRGTANCPRPPC